MVDEITAARSAEAERQKAAHRLRVKVSRMDAPTLRHEALVRMGGTPGGFYAPDALIVLEDLLARSKALWEAGERLEVEGRFRDAVRQVLETRA